MPTALAVFDHMHAFEGTPPREWVERLYDVGLHAYDAATPPDQRVMLLETVASPVPLPPRKLA